MLYSPLFELYNKHERRINDFFLQMGMMISVILVDVFFVDVLDYNLPFLSYMIFSAEYLGVYYLIRAAKKQKFFGSLANQSAVYNLVLALSTWLIYLLIIRIPRMQSFY